MWPVARAVPAAAESVAGPVGEDGAAVELVAQGGDLPVTAAVNHGLVYGCQFHPEKSGEVGLTILKNFGGLSR